MSLHKSIATHCQANDTQLKRENGSRFQVLTDYSTKKEYLF